MNAFYGHPRQLKPGDMVVVHGTKGSKDGKELLEAEPRFLHRRGKKFVGQTVGDVKVDSSFVGDDIP